MVVFYNELTMPKRGAQTNCVSLEPSHFTNTIPILLGTYCVSIAI